jgi:hypothetical protein
MEPTEKKEEPKIIDLPKILLYALELILLILLISYIYFSMIGNKDYKGIYSEHAQKEVIEALFISLKLQNVHDIPYLGITPKIQLYIREDIYFVNSYYLEIVGGTVMIKEGITQDKDIIIRTTKEEILQIIEDEDYIKESLISGRTNIEKTTSDFVLFSKGYPDLFISKNAE